MEPTAKTCTKCDETKPLEAFSLNKAGKFGRHSRCKDCCNARTSAKHAADPERRNAAARAARATDPDGYRAERRRLYAANPDRQRKASRKWEAANPETVRALGRLKSHRRRATVAGARIERVSVARVLSSTDICYLCGQGLSGTVHVDHVIPLARGGAHCEANLAPTHETCNLRKSDKLLSELDWYNGPVDLGIK